MRGAVRDHDKRGRHTTTRRALFVLPGAGLLVDTPGMRELKPWQAGPSGEEDVEEAFPDIQALAASCRYRDCKHAGEPGCAIRGALDSGALARERVASWQKLEKERAERKAKQDLFAELTAKRASRASGSRRSREKGR
jgi:ribosome biogenesis GTPase